MTIKTIVYCELGGCEEHAIVGYEGSKYDLQSPWITVVVGSASWGRHFCCFEHLRDWAISQVIHKVQFETELLPRKDQPARDVVAETLAMANQTFCQLDRCQNKAVKKVETHKTCWRVCADHTTDLVDRWTRAGVSYTVEDIA